MKRKLVMALLGLTTMFVLGTASITLATNVTPGNALTPVTGDAANDNLTKNVNNTGVGVGENTGVNVTNGDGLPVAPDLNVVKSTDTNFKFDAAGLPITTGPAEVGVQRTHGEYQNNTNSCASCHQTHTGAADNLLFKSGVYETCTACHDGTLGFYNVFTPSSAGTFSGTEAGNASVHMATGAMETKSAPGGNLGAAVASKDGLGENNWIGEFTCASCHAPHGSYSDRLLAFNPNQIASVPSKDDDLGSYTGITKAANGNVNAPTGGQMVRDVVVNVLPDATLADSPAYVLYETTATIGLDPAIIANVKYGVAGTDNVVVVMKKGTATYAKDTAPWINGGEYKSDHSYKVAFTKFYAGVAPDLTTAGKGTVLIDFQPNLTITGVTIFPQAAFAKLSAAMTIPQVKSTATGTPELSPVIALGATLVGQKADISRAFVTKLTMDPAVEWFGSVNAGVKITQVSPANYSDATKGVAISNFCASCHTDYLASSANAVAAGGTGPTGVWSKAFRHSTNSDNYTCLKCHFAHGTDVTVMMDAQDRGVATAATVLFAGDTAKATAYLLDKNASSALKRYTNMSVCWKCHTSSHNVGLSNNDYFYNTKYDADTTNNLTAGFVQPANSVLPYFKASTDLIKVPQ